MPDLGVLIRQLQEALGGKSVRGGQLTVTWPGGGALSNYVSQAHGLGRLPESVTATPNDETGSGRCAVVVFFDATNVTVRLENCAGSIVANTVTTPVSWQAIG